MNIAMRPCLCFFSCSLVILRQSTSLILQQQITALEQRALELTADGAKVRLALARQVDVTERIQAAADRKAKRLAAMLERSQTDLTAARLALREQTIRQQGEAEGEFEGAAEEKTQLEPQVSQQRRMQGRDGCACECRGECSIAECRRGSFNF